MQIQIDDQNDLVKNLKQVLEYKISTDINENMWASIEISLTSFLDNVFESKSLLTYVIILNIVLTFNKIFSLYYYWSQLININSCYVFL